MTTGAPRSTVSTRRRLWSGRSRVVLAVEACAVVIGLGVFGWAWTRPIGRDPYSTVINSMPTRHDYPMLVGLVAGGLALAAGGLVALMISVLVLTLRGRAASS